MLSFLSELNIGTRCSEARLKLWQCPPFLVLVWGLATIIIMVATYLVASRYSNDDVVIASVSMVTMISFIVGALVINAFYTMADANHMKSEFISITSHQLRSPLSIFKWTLDVVENGVKKGDGLDSISTHIPTLRNTTENMIKLVNSILAVSRIEARSLVLKNERFSLRDLTENTIAGFKEYAAASGIAITLNAQDTPLLEVFADKEYVSMVIYNLIDNAIRYTRGGGTIAVTIERKDGLLRWSIRDQGVGIPASQQKYIFQKFFRAQNTMERQTTGSGIGLYIAKAVIETSGGHVGFSSAEGKGSTFWFTLPPLMPRANTSSPVK